jgi:excinuclease ABC subunit C
MNLSQPKMSKRPRSKHGFSIADQAVYPHIKLTAEAFPRALATRILSDDGAEYFGAFLNRTSVRILIDFLNRTFRLRSCTITIDGSFPVPCTQYYVRRCHAPCVASLCDRDRYLEMVDLVRLFLRNDRELFLAAIAGKIERASDELDFETAGAFRDILNATREYWSNKRWQVWLDDTVDSYEIEIQDDLLYVIIVSQRQRRILGEKVFAFQFFEEVDALGALHDVIDQFYVHHLPREVRVSHDFPGRVELANALGKRLGRKIGIVVSRDSNRLATTSRAVDLTKARLAMERARKKLSTREIAERIARIAAIPKPPKRIEAFDAAHISATGFAAAASVWLKGVDAMDEYEHWMSDRGNELDTLSAFVVDRVRRTQPDLVLVDGGKPQLRAARQALEKANLSTPVIAAVKPKSKHSSISHFIASDDSHVAFDQDNQAHRVLARLRDDAHDLSNAAHRLGRDMLHFYELAAMIPSVDESQRQALLREFGSLRRIAALEQPDLESRFGKSKGAKIFAEIRRYNDGDSAPARPLIVPIRYVETGGGAEDLIPISTR